MAIVSKRRALDLALWGAAGMAFAITYARVAEVLLHTWLSDPEFSYGILILPITAYLIWRRRERLRAVPKGLWPKGFLLVAVGAVLQILGSLSGTLIFSGLGFAICTMGIVGVLWGRAILRAVAVPLCLLVLMIPVPSYILGQLTWYLQVTASTLSAGVLGVLGIPVYQDGNILRLPNYVLEVKQACSGSRSIFALLAMALLLGMSVERKWRVRIPLLLAAPALAIAANVVRIVGTGLIAWWFGNLAANESLHTAWGVVVFLIAMIGLIGFQRFLRWATHAYA